jgi:murein DD-endopeptidase MepM/ murein hydrolase activator NlpD/endonuclease/exonuclease/phosphatase family metal-dependent hydrolase
MRRRRIAVVAVLATAGALGIGFILVLGAMMGAQEDDSGCSDLAGPVLPVSASKAGGLSSSQLANAGAVIAEGRRRGVPAQAVVIALAVAGQESHFTNYANDGRGSDLDFFQRGIEASLALPHEAVGSDHGSLGVFQQQWPWWGSMADLMNPARAAGKFYAALLKVPGWQGMPVTVAAQAVQRSAFPDAYADDEALARQLLGGTEAVPAVGRVSDAGTGAGPGTGTLTASCLPAADPGTVVFPLPRDASYVDNRNWGGRGAHWARFHTGTDLSVACGTPVLAATGGRVVIRTDQAWAGRWLVEVSTGIGRLTTWYAHMRAVTVSNGATVAAGQQIGQVGDLGNATGCHLHFEVHPQGGSIYQDSVNPSTWLAENVGRSAGTVAPASWSSDSSAFTLATFNTLGDSHTSAGGKARGKASGTVRTRGLVRLLDRYGVDVVGLQEFQRPQYRAFTSSAGATYATWSASGDTENSIAWRRARWDLVSADTVGVPYFGGHVRRMPVVLLRDRETGRQAYFVNVHNPADTRRFPRQSRWRTAGVAREVALVRRLQQNGRGPVFLTGDLNDRRQAFCRLAGDASMHASNGGSTAGGCTPATGAGIDWILATSAADFSDHTLDRSSLVTATSDHPFVVTRARVR